MSINIIKPMAMPEQTVQAFPKGATSIMNAGIINSQAQTQQQMALIGKSGGKRIGGKRIGSKSKRKRVKGGASTQVLVPAVPAGTPNSGATAENYKSITALAQSGAANAVYDTAKTPAQTAAINASLQNKIGGNREVRWGCLSGGKRKSRKSRKSRKGRKSRKSRK
jgi:hypothetical protein